VHSAVLSELADEALHVRPSLSEKIQVEKVHFLFYIIAMRLFLFKI
jgi:hypothetical protein